MNILYTSPLLHPIDLVMWSGGFDLIFLTFPMSALSTALLTIGVKKLALRVGALAKRDDRRRHWGRTPLLGGAGFYVPIVGFTLFFTLHGLQDGSALITPRYAACFIGAISLIFGVGVVDDLMELKAFPKLLTQVTAAILVLLGSPHLPTVFNPIVHPALIVPILIIWIIGVTNALNMIDGLDGLAAGIAGITGFTLASILISSEGNIHSFPLVLMLATAGCSVGFLLHNFHPARIFLGDSGSLLIGFVLAVVSIQVEVKRSLFISLSMPIFVLGLPILDVAISIIRRRTLQRSVFKGDRSHIHHRLQQLGLSQRGAVILLWMAAGYLNLTAYFLSKIPANLSLFIYASVAATLGFWFLALVFIEKRLSSQLFQFSSAFMRADMFNENKDSVYEYLRKRIHSYERNKEPFSVVIVDGDHFIKEITHETPERLIGFYMQLYSILRSRLRTSDFVGRLSEHVFIVILPGDSVDRAHHSPITDYLKDKIKELQKSYYIFQTNKRKPEGFTALSYPRDKARIERIIPRKGKQETRQRPSAKAA